VGLRIIGGTIMLGKDPREGIHERKRSDQRGKSRSKSNGEPSADRQAAIVWGQVLLRKGDFVI